ncbi:fibronectin type III domain-containing protein [Flavobacterium anhuiense]|uniref:fibronectin type III domain-containing protein n=1 Tax=Flavobacterium anhuiense TaxID=459526 RepID=UPI002026EAF6|nr:fibronectin type III domain-containing protein [Flavobacterium anhuiense]URM35129.1 fibronectin type III domain-containing protein [Flavobacterium anhuiense]
MKKLFHNFYSLIVVLFFSLNGQAQLYPVQLTPIFKSPYSIKISDYAASMDTKMQLLINPTDLSINNRQIRLKLYIQGNGLNIQTSDYVQGQKPIYINGGELQTLTNTDIASLFRLENLQGITASQYALGLPEGMYSFCFEMYDYITNQKISQKSCASLYLILNDPPLLNTPQKNEQIAASDFPNIIFTWTPRQINATNISYKFEIKQLLDPTLDPQIAFQMTPVLYEETLFGTAMLYNLSMPILTPGMRYAWRVRAVSTTGLSENAVFKNDGYSEIYSFKYTSSCAAPTFLLSEAQGPNSVKITWQGLPEHTKYQLQYKKQDVRNAQWFSTNSLNTQSLITNLEPGVTYQFRVGSSCDSASEGIQSFTYSGISTFTTPTQISGVSAYNCGIIPKINIQNQKPLTNLIQSETFTAGDFPVTILELKGENSPYSGRGYIIVPYLADTKIAVEFNNIVVNTDYQLISGVVETSYNPDSKNVVDVEDFTGEGQSGKIKEEIKFEIDKIIINANGDIIVNGKDGEQVTILGGKDTVITDGTGKIYYVDKDGNGSNEGIVAAEGGKPTQENTDGVDKNGQATAFTAQGITIAFSANDSKYAFDIMPDNATPSLQKTYKQAGKNFLPYKAVLNGDTDIVLAVVTATDSEINLDDIVFKTESGAKVDAIRNDKIFTLTVRGSLNYAEEQILATIKQGDKWKVIGAFVLVHISPKEVNVALVPTDDTSQSKLDEVIINTQKIYDKVGVKINFTKEPVLNIESVVSGNTIQTEKNTITSTYSTHQQEINSLYQSTESSYVLFVTNKISSTGQQGYMRLNGQFGYVFNSETALSKTPAHELGHGIFKLEHPFEVYKTAEKSTDLLMDYSAGTVLNHHDWKQINDPAFRLYMFQSQSSGEYETDGHYSTVYLVSLMLGMNPAKAKELAEATEGPDTDVHSETSFELDETWSDAEYQETIHSLTGGFHGTEEFLTAIQFIYTPKENISKLGELLHRFGDTYAHTKLDNIKPENLGEYNLYENPENEKLAIKSWKGQGSIRLKDKVEPWILFFNYYLKKYGMGFFTSYTKQREVFKGKTLKEVLNDIYLVNYTDKYIMYGGEKNILGITKDHAFSDGSFPDKIYLRPKWYLDYVKNLAWLLSAKYNLNGANFDIKIFEKMTTFAVSNKCSLKGLIDYEIAKKKQKTKFYIPVLYSNPNRIAASYDAVKNTDYYQTALDVVEKAKLYISKDGIYKNIVVNPIKDMNVKYNVKTGFFRTSAFEINLKK